VDLERFSPRATAGVDPKDGEEDEYDDEERDAA
jgi:hypothetical protein